MPTKPRALAGLILAATAAGLAPAPAMAQEPTPVIVQNTPLPVSLGPTATVNVRPPKIFRRKVTGQTPFTNQTNDLLVIDRVSGFAPWDTRVLTLLVFTDTGQHEVYFPSTQGGTGFPVHAMTQVYVMPGERLEVGQTYETAHLSGHYEPLPPSRGLTGQ